ncbi:MAG: hypothetical protein ACPIOQ_61185, partial [Promethearchaeia archaeon]
HRQAKRDQGAHGAYSDTIRVQKKWPDIDILCRGEPGQHLQIRARKRRGSSAVLCSCKACDRCSSMCLL